MASVVNSFLGNTGSEAATQGAQLNQAQIQQGIDALRESFGQTEQQISPFIQAGQGALGQLQAGSTVGGLDQILGQIFGSENFQALSQERGRAVQGQLAAGGLTRSGTALSEAARVPTDLGFQIEQLLTGRAGQLAGQGQNAALGLGQLRGQSAGEVAELFGTSGGVGQQGVIGAAEAEAAGAQNLVNLGTTIASIFFSDPILKENIETIGEIHNLKIYQWDWIEGAKGTIIEKCGTIGFMANQVKEIYPQFVHEYCGFLTIDYPRLLDELEAI